MRRPGAHRERSGLGQGARLALFAVLFALGPAGAETITGVCPDGSIFVVRSAAAIPCADARRVEPDQVPPIKPQYLPRPYAWELFQSRQDPNNPYNLVEAGHAAQAPPAGAATAPPPATAPPEARGSGPEQVAAARSASAARSEPPRPPAAPAADLALSADEIRDLVAIIELSQERAPATLGEAGADGPGLLVRLARSAAFEARLQEAWAAAGRPLTGPVVLFSAEARARSAFYANLTFAQGHVAYYPDHGDPRQFGLLRGRQGELVAGEMVLGYVVLPERADLGEPIDIYWNDRRITATLVPAS
jgi:hypothetical protein